MISNISEKLTEKLLELTDLKVSSAPNKWIRFEIEWVGEEYPPVTILDHFITDDKEFYLAGIRWPLSDFKMSDKTDGCFLEYLLYEIAGKTIKLHRLVQQGSTLYSTAHCPSKALDRTDIFKLKPELKKSKSRWHTQLYWPMYQNTPGEFVHKCSIGKVPSCEYEVWDNTLIYIFTHNQAFALFEIDVDQQTAEQHYKEEEKRFQQ